MSFHIWLMFSLAYLATTLIPGPNVLLVVKNTVQHGWRSTLVTIAGNLMCQLLIVTLVALGISTLLQTLPSWFVVMKVIGGLYLIYLGLKSFRGRKASSFQGIEAKKVKAKSSGALFLQAFLVSASNPKTMIFLSAFLPQFLTLDRPAVVQFGVMFFTICMTVATVHIGYSFGMVRLSKRFSFKRLEDKIAKATGGIFIAMGGGVLLSNR